jgi:hypothetical protein
VSYDRDYVMRIIRARCSDVLSDDDLASVEAMSQPAEMLPIEIGEQILTVLDALQDRLEALAESLRQKPPPAKTVIGACRQAMIDLDLDAKADVVDQLLGWVEAERGTYEPLQ